MATQVETMIYALQGRGEGETKWTVSYTYTVHHVFGKGGENGWDQVETIKVLFRPQHLRRFISSFLQDNVLDCI